ncbi:hypothetical protein ASE17_04415 [Phenylobacterium sp. Root77]|jgi:hypothetical protein|uniref:hypothetical protein n=1 Tax=unclassified Phenylobacterium TaxID=2640670 RepID=UPI0006F39D2C|nr:MULTISPECIES: hypothetical protein [unclassified Phenylobacterium]KQW72117.1 hypothetical protein ASC73_08640 [Phenylobacterium sp. Root1277]KQW95037.1 hypothetical protein ASC79_04785 [Phenylobacterium sp. Root1290]KRC44730.1 hypothetical protein ASE17_04415 [Phenylobacterium sp. Root77]
MKILVGTPTYNGQVTGQYTRSMLELQAMLGASMGWESTKAVIISTARNLLASRVLETDHTHLLFVDADVSFPASVVQKMIALDEPVVAGIYPQRALNVAAFHAAARKHADPNTAFAAALSYPVDLVEPHVTKGDFYEAQTAPTGLMLIKREVFEALREADPSLYRSSAGSYYAHQNLKNVLQCFEPLADENGVAMSEDISFCHRWRALGGKIWTLFDHYIAHTGPYTFRPMPAG